MKKFTSLLMAAAMTVSVSTTAFAAASAQTVDAAVQDTAEYVYHTVSKPQVGSIGGEWAVLGLARSGYAVPESYYQDYYRVVEDYVEELGGVLHKKKYTEYSRLIVALSSIGKDARNVAGYDLTYALGDYDKTIWQGMNGPIWALIALDSRNYPIPQNEEARTQATRQMYVDRILDCQLSDGGWSLFGGTASASDADSRSDPDITGMALQALAKYQDQAEVKEATEEALDCMSRQQSADGGFSSWGTANAESCVQMIVALCELGIPMNDARFIKNGNSLLDNLMTYYKPGSGFVHTLDGSGESLMATEQAFYGLVAVQRARQGKNSLYRMGDAITVSGVTDVPQAGQGLDSKNPDVKPMPVVEPGKTFPDVAGHPNQTAIEDLSSRGIINGMNGVFAPDANMTRAQFAAIMVRGLGLPEKAGNHFDDVPAGRWYASVVGTANAYGIINGKGNNQFDPEGNITRQEAAAMVTRAAKLCGMETEMNAMGIRDTLAAFGDYVKTAEWSRPYLAFCYAHEILDSSALNINAEEMVCRCEIAQMLYNMLGLAKLR